MDNTSNDGAMEEFSDMLFQIKTKEQIGKFLSQVEAQKDRYMSEDLEIIHQVLDILKAGLS